MRTTDWHNFFIPQNNSFRLVLWKGPVDLKCQIGLLGTPLIFSKWFEWAAKKRVGIMNGDKIWFMLASARNDHAISTNCSSLCTPRTQWFWDLIIVVAAIRTCDKALSLKCRHTFIIVFFFLPGTKHLLPRLLWTIAISSTQYGSRWGNTEGVRLVQSTSQHGILASTGTMIMPPALWALILSKLSYTAPSSWNRFT